MSNAEPSGSSVYAAFIAGLLEEQDARKASLEQRALAVVTTAGALVSLLFGLVALISEADGFTLPRSAHGPLGVGLALFVGAGVLALVVNVPLIYTNADPEAIARILDRYWSDSVSDAEMRVAATREKMFKAAQDANELKAWLLVGALTLEVLGVVAVAIAVSEVLEAA
jgi:hypothetical protein